MVAYKSKGNPPLSREVWSSIIKLATVRVLQAPMSACYFVERRSFSSGYTGGRYHLMDFCGERKKKPLARRVTVRDVAAAAGVSTSTASRVLANKPSVNAQLAQRVLEASEKLGYRASLMARALRTGESGNVAIVVPNLIDPHFVAIVRGIESALAESDRILIVCDSKNSVAVEAQRIRALTEPASEGKLIVVPVTSYKSAPIIIEAAKQVPVVLLDRWSETNQVDYVGTDNEEGMRQITEHLSQQGCENLVYVGETPLNNVAYERNKAFRELCGIPLGRDAVPGRILLGELSSAWGKDAARSLVTSGAMPDGIVCGSDIIAVGVLEGLREAGVRVPDDATIVSFDDTVLCEATFPQLSSVRQPIEELAAEALRVLDTRAGGSAKTATRITFLPNLVVRQSSKR